MRKVYREYLKNGDELSYSDAKKILLDEVGQDPERVRRVFNRSWELDRNGNGTVDFVELGNFLLRLHCHEKAFNKFYRDRQLRWNTRS